MKKALLMGLCIAALGACQAKETGTESETINTEISNTKTSMVEDTAKTAYQMNKDARMDYTKAGQTDSDHIWLEDVLGEKALAKVGAWNDASAAKMQGAVYQDIKKSLLEVYNSPAKIPYVSYRAGQAHNFWQDEDHVKGIWRATTLESYATDSPVWETVLDVDAVAKADGENWVYKGNDCFAPDYTRCMVTLSIGGKDASVRREYDTVTKSFVEGGFVLPESKGGTAWLDKDTLLVGVDFGEGTMTDSGYPLVSKIWTRGTPLSEARELMRGEKKDVGVFPGTFENADGEDEIMVVRAMTFYTTEYYWVPRTGEAAFTPVKLPVPEKTNLGGQFKGQQLVTLQEDWKSFKSGTLVSFSIAEFMASGKIDKIHEVITPTAKQSIGSTGVTKSALLLSLYEDVSGAAYAFDFDGSNWSKTKIDFSEDGNVSVGTTNSKVSIGATNSKEDVAFINTESFLSPDTLWSLDVSTLKSIRAKSLPSWFDAQSMVAEQQFSISTDGTKIPYFIVHKKDMKLDGTNPTLLYGYGGFEISIEPSYSATIGRAWLERGGVYVSANIRGGGEYGPAWHQAGLKTKRQIVYDDFISVAEDLIANKVTSPQHLGIHGRSNGGLLMGVMFTQRPDLFNAIVCGVPLLDMQRYHKLLAGASWVGEYGNPEDTGAEGEYIRTLSPYHNIRPDVEYPEMYIYTSTKDDRVHPAHARKMAQRLEDQGHSFLYYENIDGGHAGAANLDETAHSYALIYAYLADKLDAK